MGKEIKFMLDFNNIDIEEYPRCIISDIKFYNFLKNNDAYYKFVNNLHIEMSYGVYYGKYWNNIRTFCDDMIISVGVRCYISYAFKWDNTSEGRDFWRYIDALWLYKNT